MFVAWAALEIVVYAGQSLGAFYNLAAHMIFLVGFAGLGAGFIALSLKASRGERPAFSDLFAQFEAASAMLAAQLLYLVAVAAGLVFLVVPGLIIAARLGFFGFYLVDGNTQPVRALRASTALTGPSTVALVGIEIVLLLLNVFGALWLGLGLLITIPVTVLTLTALYRQLAITAQPATPP